MQKNGVYMSRRLILSIVLGILVLSLSGIHDEAGTTGFNFLKINFAPRSVALGNAYCALMGIPDAMLVNPAGIRGLQSGQLSTSYLSHFEGFNAGAVSYAWKRTDNMNLGVHLEYMDSGAIDRTIVDDSGNYGGTDGSFSATDLAIGFTGAFVVNPVLDMGVTVKFLNESIDGNSASVVTADIGVVHQTTNPNVRVGAVVSNVGFQLSYFTDSEYDEGLPTEAKIGFTYIPDDKLTTLLDVTYALSGGFHAGIGAEYRIHPIMALRGGYRTNASDWQLGGDWEFLSGISLGMGINWRKYRFDYAFSSYGDLGTQHMLGVLYQF